MSKKECTKHTIMLCDENKKEVRKAMARFTRQCNISDGLNWLIEDYRELKRRLGM